MLPGVRPIIRLASAPTATTEFVVVSTATTDGSFEQDPAAACVDQRVRGAEVDGEIPAEQVPAALGHQRQPSQGRDRHDAEPFESMSVWRDRMVATGHFPVATRGRGVTDVTCVIRVG